MPPGPRATLWHDLNFTLLASHAFPKEATASYPSLLALGLAIGQARQLLKAHEERWEQLRWHERLRFPLQLHDVACRERHDLQVLVAFRGDARAFRQGCQKVLHLLRTSSFSLKGLQTGDDTAALVN